VPLFVHNHSCIVVHRLAVPLSCFAFNAFVIYRDSGPVPDLSFLPTIELTWQSLPQVPPFSKEMDSKCSPKALLQGAPNEHAMLMRGNLIKRGPGRQ
jgi:hypothetical protein